tara:strand:+ start:31 stop:717 length:687 start_codon:yes stop_codon:yes gene_type:complete
MGFKLRSTEGASPLKQGNYNLEQLERQYSEYGPADAEGNRTRTYEVKNAQTHRNKKQSASTAKIMHDRSLNDEDSRGYAGGNKGGILSSTKTIGGTGVRSTKFNESGNERSTEKDIRKALNKFGSAEVVDGVVQGRSTHQESKTINSRQYDALSGKITKYKAKQTARTTKEATNTAKLAEKKKAQIARVTAKRTASAASKAAIKSKRAAALEARKNALIAKREAKNKN